MRADSREHGVRYTTPQAVRDFAAKQLTASGEEHAVRSAHAEHTASIGETFRGFRDPIGGRIFALEAEKRVALDWTRAHAPDLHTRVAAALGLVLLDTGRAREAYTELGLAIERSGIAGAAGGRAAVVRAQTALVLGRPDEGAPLIEPGLAALRATGDESLLELGLRAAGALALRRPTRAQPRGHERGARDRAPPIRRRRPRRRAALPGTDARRARPPGRGRAVDRRGRAAARAGRLQRGRRRLDHRHIAVERGDWALAARSYADAATDLARTHNTGALIEQLRMTVVALANLGADEEALELEAGTRSMAAQSERHSARCCSPGTSGRYATRANVSVPSAPRAPQAAGASFRYPESGARCVELVRAAAVTSAT